MRAIILASILACLPLLAEDEATCPLCGKKVAAFEDSPKGALRKFQFALITRDEALLRDATHGLDEKMQKQAVDADPRRWEIARWIVFECQVDGDHATLQMGETGSDRRNPLPAIRVEGKWKIDLGPAHAAAQETVAKVLLRQIVSTESVWRQTDSDGNGAQDYWTKDIAAFYYMNDGAGSMLKYVDLRLAMADRMGLASYTKEPAAPKNGYWLRVMKTDDGGVAYVLDGDGDGVSNTNPAKYAFCAYPAEYGKGLTLTYIVNEEGVVYEKDLGPDAKEGIDAWPGADPTTKGWKACE